MHDTDSAVAARTAALRAGMDRAVLSFPLTAFSASGDLDLGAYRALLEHQLAASPGALFVCCGTGEFFSLDLEEYAACVRAAVELAPPEVPVVAGAGHGVALATRYVRAAEEAGAAAVLLLPHYLTEAPQAGLAEHVRRVAAATTLPVVIYHRGQARYAVDTVTALAAEVPNLVGLKDGTGDIEHFQALRLATPPDFLFFNGVPTAELQARAYAAIGIPAYSSAVHAFAPEIAGAFHTALRSGDEATADRLLSGFYLPLARIRDRTAGYAVSLVKAAARLRGLPAGPVRPPLADPGPEDLADLERVLAAGLELI
ncbi:5-dehydro-4-deoxyglucarate dehydratase [Actinoallomurus sp. NPDC050550]|uniref:5-dehydro-4-deoxyglucarate dehydratase n=1 Tax=Actinoallomurus sp. NPDC050550 TaxID=3154937 RepID=UPI0033F97E01